LRIFLFSISNLGLESGEFIIEVLVLQVLTSYEPLDFLEFPLVVSAGDLLPVDLGLILGEGRVLLSEESLHAAVKCLHLPEQAHVVTLSLLEFVHFSLEVYDQEILLLRGKRQQVPVNAFFVH
jgi:hypothetical protein